MRTQQILLFLVIATMVLGGCAAGQVGREIDRQTFNTIQPGETTCRDAIRRLGEPATLVEDDDNRMMEYKYEKMELTSVSKVIVYIPIVNLFHGYYNTVQEATVKYRPDNVVTETN